MKIVQGDLFSVNDHAIGHGVNCKGVMGSGIAVGFKSNYPEMFEEYRELCLSGELRPGGFFPYYDGARWVYNIASQDGCSRWRQEARLEWLASGVKGALKHCEGQGERELHLPLIGAGLGGLKEKDVLDTLKQVERNHNVIIVVHKL